MKKLALALVCFASVAFFASCTPEITNPEPSIAVFVGSEGYLYDGAVIDVNVEYPFAFRAASNAETQKDLATFKIYIDDELQLDSIISGKEFEFSGNFAYELRDNIIDETSIKAVVTDVDGKMNTATINLNVNQPAQPLVARAFTWNRHGGNDATGLDEFGLKWERNLSKAIYAVIEPVDGAILYKFDPSVWNATTTDLEKASLFSEATPADPQQWKEFNVAGATTQEFDVVLGTFYNDEFHLMHITKGSYYSFKGTDATIEGEAK